MQKIRIANKKLAKGPAATIRDLWYRGFKIKSFFGFRTWGVNRKDLSWGEILSGSIRPNGLGKCKIIDTEQNLISSLETMIEDNLKRNKI